MDHAFAFQQALENLQDVLHEWEYNDKRYVVVGPVQLPVRVGDTEQTFRWYSYRKIPQDQAIDLEWLVRDSERQQTFSSILVYGDFEEAATPAVRLHSVCQTGDVFGSLRCDCGPQLKLSMEKIAKDGVGALFYLALQEGRGIGLLAKALTYKLQQGGVDTFEANRLLGCDDDQRDYEEAAAMLAFLRGRKPVTLMTNNPAKLEKMRAFGIAGAIRDDHTVPSHVHNQNYMRAKIEAGHLVDQEIMEAKATK